MAFLTVEDVYGSMECVCFPGAYEKLKGDIATERIVKVKGKLDVDAEKGISLIVDDIAFLDSSKIGEPASGTSAKREQAVLWLNAGKLDDETFDEFIGMLSNYEGAAVCKIVRGDKRYKLPAGVNYCRGLLAELGAFIEKEDIKFIDKN